MMPVELYWPAEILAQVFPREYGKPTQNSGKRKSAGLLYTVEQRGNCHVLWLGNGQRVATPRPTPSDRGGNPSSP